MDTNAWFVVCQSNYYSTLYRLCALNNTNKKNNSNNNTIYVVPCAELQRHWAEHQ